MHDIWVDVDLICCWFVFSLSSFGFVFSIWAFFLYFLIEYLPRFFFPLFAYRKGKQKTHFFIRVCGSISPSFFRLFPFELYIYISLVSVFVFTFLQSFLVLTCSKCWFWLSYIRKNLALYLSIFFPIHFRLLPLSLALYFVGFITFPFFCIDSKIFRGGLC